MLSDDLPALLLICRVINHMDPDPTFVSAKPRATCGDSQLADT